MGDEWRKLERYYLIKNIRYCLYDFINKNLGGSGDGERIGHMQFVDIFSIHQISRFTFRLIAYWKNQKGPVENIRTIQMEFSQEKLLFSNGCSL